MEAFLACLALRLSLLVTVKFSRNLGIDSQAATLQPLCVRRHVLLFAEVPS